MRSLVDKIVVITGASRGIGRAAANLFAEQGATVVCLARSSELLNSLVGELTTVSTHEHSSFVCDITDRQSVQTVIENIVSRYGRIDIWVNNAGIGAHRSLMDTTVEDFDAIMNVNVRGVFHTFKELIPLFMNQPESDGLKGHIINISSGVARIGTANIAVYAASKAALNLLSESVANEVRNDAIKISTLSPASTATDFMRNYKKPLRDAALSPSRAKSKLTPEEVAEAILFEASQNANAWTSMADIRPLSIKK